MRYKKKIISLASILALISTNISFADTFSSKLELTKDINTNLSMYKQNNINDMFTIQTKEIKQESEFFKSDIKYPYLKIKEEYINNNKVNKKHIENINKQIENYIIKFNNKIKKEAKEYQELYETKFSKSDEDYVKYQYELISDFKVTYNKNNLISIPITTYAFMGGAHGMTYLKSFNYDLSTGKEIKLKDVFKEDVNYKEIVNSFVKKEIEKSEDIYFGEKEGFNGINENQEFYIEEGKLVIYFQLYDIAPYYVGIPKFEMTVDEFGEYFKMKF
ncbi:DUF3298/DUF4163 domain-containing protein [Romboutsia maritimum]|uniref:DUF3298/DUF4163 domain-containing protein n=1 Tax=Romboutsia maritimum TaxID=2020948 RepID=A0A371IRR5_9FIRM|nr:DUF3298 and DUF4163 domain-containing protein [Romboutsia maritimum]RDY23177.1 DUF3298/DUF4163 domain-containing protein [Romboutsia maritimum]